MNATPTPSPKPASAVYVVRPTAKPPSLNNNWFNPVWKPADTAEVRHFRPESSAHHPRTSIRLLHSAKGISGIFRVEDCYVRCLRTEYQSEVWKDSCVEFFAQPKPGRGYINFEFNCGGAHLCSYIVNPERTSTGFKEFTRIPREVGRRVQVRTSLPRVLKLEITRPATWTLRFFIPFAVFEHYVGSLGSIGGQTWRGNFFKCAEENSHPHWAAWAPVDEFNFHLPRCFGEIKFAPAAV